MQRCPADRRRGALACCDMEIAGLPLHPLVVHAAVVLIPLTALLSIVLATLPRWRWLVRWPTAALSMACVAVAYVATVSGRSLEQARRLQQLMASHAAHGRMLLQLTVLLALVVVVAAAVLPGPSLLASGRGAVARRVSYVDKVLPALLVVVALVVLVEVYLTGESGARAVWG